MRSRRQNRCPADRESSRAQQRPGALPSRWYAHRDGEGRSGYLCAATREHRGRRRLSAGKCERRSAAQIPRPSRRVCAATREHRGRRRLQAGTCERRSAAQIPRPSRRVCAQRLASTAAGDGCKRASVSTGAQHRHPDRPGRAPTRLERAATPPVRGTGRIELPDARQIGVRHDQPLAAGVLEIDLHPGVAALTLVIQHHPLAELRMRHPLAQPEPGRTLARGWRPVTDR